MNEQQVAQAVRDWAKAVLPELKASRHYLSAQKTELPDVQADVARKRLVRGPDERFPFAQLQQAGLRIFDCELSLMVERDEEAGVQADQRETEQLRDFGDRLEASLLADATLGDRVQMASPLAEFDYSSPFVEWADGTRGRQLVVTLAVAELVSGLGGF